MKKESLKRQFFIAVFPSPRATQPLAALRGKGPSHWQWKNPPDFHISLAFPGRLEKADVHRLKNILSRIDYPAFPLRFDAVRYFPGRTADSRHVLWAAPDKSAAAQLMQLQEKIAAALKKNGFPTGELYFTPHVTLARPDRGDFRLMKEFAKAHGTLRTPVWKCDRFLLCETDGPEPQAPAPRRPGAGRYRAAASFRLKG